MTSTPSGSDLPPRDEGIFAAIGRAVSCWAELEDAVFKLFHQIVKTDEAVAAAIYFSFLNFSNRLNLIDEVFKVAYPAAAEASYWKSLKSITFSLSVERNFIAHNPVYLMFSQDPDAAVAAGEEGELMTVTDPTEETHRGRKQRVRNVDQIEALYSDFSDLIAEYRAFRHHLSGRKPLPQKFAEPVRDLPLAKYDQSQQGAKKPQRLPRSSRS